MVLGNGLEEIRPGAFRECTSLERIDIPPAIKVIQDSAFYRCSRLKRVESCNEL